MVHRFVIMGHMKEMGFSVPEPDCFTVECFLIIKSELERQRALKEKHGKVNR